MRDPLRLFDRGPCGGQAESLGVVGFAMACRAKIEAPSASRHGIERGRKAGKTRFLHFPLCGSCSLPLLCFTIQQSDLPMGHVGHVLRALWVIAQKGPLRLKRSYEPRHSPRLRSLPAIFLLLAIGDGVACHQHQPPTSKTI